MRRSGRLGGLVTQSEVRAFRQCRRKHDFQYVQLLRKIGSYHYPFFIGNMVHEGLDMHYKGNNFAAIKLKIESEFKKRWHEPGCPPEHMQGLPLVLGMIAGYIEHHRISDSKLKVIKTEFEFVTKLANDLPRYTGKVDGLVQDRENNYFPMEHKTADSIGDNYFRLLQVDVQYPMYTHAIESELGIRMRGTIYNVLRKGLPEEPEVVYKGKKNERLSTSLGPNLTYEKYYGAIMRHGYSEADYAPQLNELLMRKENFFMREILFPSMEFISGTVDEFKMTVREMDDFDTPVYPSPGLVNCQSCSYFSLCAVYHDKKQFEQVREVMFEKKEVKHEELSSTGNTAQDGQKSFIDLTT